MRRARPNPRRPTHAVSARAGKARAPCDGRPDDGSDMRYMPGMRAAWLTLGWACVGLGLVGVALPLLPTTVFMLAAAGCFARSSPALADWLHAHPRFGPPLADWRAHGVIRPAAKRAAVATMAASLLAPLALGAAPWVTAVQGAALAAVAAFILTRPSRAA